VDLQVRVGMGGLVKSLSLIAFLLFAGCVVSDADLSKRERMAAEYADRIGGHFIVCDHRNGFSYCDVVTKSGEVVTLWCDDNPCHRKHWE
jgi:hypothetical protein